MNNLLKGALLAGGGAVTVGLARRALGPVRPRYEPWERRPYGEFARKVLVVGGGFAGYNAVEKLCKLSRGRDDVGVMLVSQENYFTFWPMLASVIGGDVQTKNVAQPLRRTLIRLGASFRRAALEGVDPERRVVRAGGREFPYDHLVLSLGAQPAYFGIPGVEEHAISIRGIGSGEEISDRVIERYEETTLAGGEVPEGKLTFVLIGGGATRVEVAAELHNLLQELLVSDYPNIAPDSAKIILVDRNKEILKELDPALRRDAQAARGAPDRGHQQRQGRGDHRRQGDPGRRPRDRERERYLDHGRLRERETRRPDLPPQRAQWPYGGPLSTGHRPRGRVGHRRLRLHGGRGR